MNSLPINNNRSSLEENIEYKNNFNTYENHYTTTSKRSLEKTEKKQSNKKVKIEPKDPVIEEMIQKTLETLKKTFSLFEQDFNFYWGKNLNPTGQNRNDLENSLRFLLSMKREQPIGAFRLRRVTRNSKSKDTYLTVIDLTDGGLLGAFKKMKKVGEGSYSNVYSYSSCIEKDKHYAIKTQNSAQDRQKAQLSFCQDYNMLEKLHENKVPSIQAAAEYIFTLFRGNTKRGLNHMIKLGSTGTLYSGDTRSSRFDKKVWGTERLIRALRKIAISLNTFHALKIYHGDLKPENILRDDKENEFFIADMGGITDFAQKGISLNFSYTENYTHSLDTQKLISAKEKNNEEDYCFIRSKMDIFSFGATSYEILTDLMPYKLDKHCVKESPYKIEVLFEALKNSFHSDCEIFNKKKDTTINKLGTLIHKMVSINHAERPNMDQVIKELNEMLD